MDKFRHYSKLLAFPLIIIFAFVTLNWAWSLLNIPPGEELALLVRDWYNSYGLPILFLSSIVEGALVVGSYFPGVFVIFLGVILAESAGQAAVAVVVLSIGLLIAHVLNYVLGRYGWYHVLVKFGMSGAMNDAKEKLEKRGPIAILLSYWMPSLGALTDTAAGIIRLPFRTFITYAVVSTIIWNTIVGVAVYYIGDKALAVAAPNDTRTIVFFVIISVWILLLVIADHWGKKTGGAPRAVDNEGIQP